MLDSSNYVVAFLYRNGTKKEGGRWGSQYVCVGVLLCSRLVVGGWAVLVRAI